MSGVDGSCRWLRSRATYGEGGGLPGLHGGAEAAWCLLTQEPSGPDEAVADATTCRLGRACFQSRRTALARAPGDAESGAA